MAQLYQLLFGKSKKRMSVIMIDDMRCVNVRGITYFRAEDVAKYIRELGNTEPTDTQKRLDEAAHIFEEVNKPVES